MGNKSDKERLEELLLEEKVKKMVANECYNILSEMAVDRSFYKDRIRDICPQIIINWCLVHYCSLSNDKEILKNHWKSELITHLNNIGRLNLKGKNNPGEKEKLLYKVWNENDYDTNENSIHRTICLKFEKEGISTRGEIYSDIIEDCKNATKDIVKAATSEIEEIKEYVNTI